MQVWRIVDCKCRDKTHLKYIHNGRAGKWIMAEMNSGKQPNKQQKRWQDRRDAPVAIGICLGLAAGTAMGNLGAGMAIGIAIGVAVAASKRTGANNKDG